MATHILKQPEQIRKKSSSERFNEAFAPIAEGYFENLQAQKMKQQQMAQQQQQQKQIAEYLQGGGSLENLPVEFQLQVLKGQQEQQKPFAKYGAQKQFMEGIGLGDTFGGGRGSQRGQEPSQEQPSMKEPGVMDIGTVKVPRMFSEDDILKMSMVNPSSAQQMRAHNQSVIDQQRHEEKQVSETYKENQSYIDKTYDQYEDSLRRDAILDRMEQLEDSEELSDSGIINFLETLGMKPEWLKNPKNEEYNKLGLDLLGGGSLQADYGSRVLQSEFKVSMQRIPTLSQTPEGRRQIRENIKAMLLPSRLKYERMQYYLNKSERTGESLPHNLRGKILNDIKPQLEEAYDKFKQRNGRYEVKKGTFPDDNAIEKYFYLSNGNEEKAMKMMKEDGYDVQ